MQINGINSSMGFTGTVKPELADYIQKQTKGAIREEDAKSKLTGEIDTKQIETYLECRANLMKILQEKADTMGENAYIGLEGGDAENPNLTLVVGIENKYKKHSSTTPIAKIKQDDPYNPYEQKTKIQDIPSDWILEVKGIENMTGSVYKPEYQLQSLARMARRLAPEESHAKAAEKAYGDLANKNTDKE